jgi:hypothetical protein
MVGVSTSWCEKFQLPADQCAHCLGTDQQSGAVRRLSQRPTDWIEAKFSGRCAGCYEPVEVGDMIRQDGMGGWIGECCS